MLSNNDYYKPEDALKHIYEQQAHILTAIDVQVVLQLLIEKGLTNVGEINDMRQKVSNLPKYRATIDNLESERKAMEKAVNNPNDYLKELLKAKMNGDIK